MKLPNGYGSVKKLTGKRRNPWIAQKTTGWIYNETRQKAVQQRVPIGYFPTRAEALAALAAFNQDPYNLDARNITFGEIYDIWSEKHFAKVSKSTMENYKSAFRYCASIANKPIRNIRQAELQAILDECGMSGSTKANIKVVMNFVFTFALQNDYINKNYVDFVTFENTDPTIDRIPFSDTEIRYLWEHSERFEIRILLILLYTGMRVNELLQMPHDCCHLPEKYLDIQKAKNKASIRKVPIHSRILPFLEAFYDKNGKNLIVNDSGCAVLYNNFVSRQLPKINQELQSSHRMHDTRHTFITNAKRYDMDYMITKKIVGHAPDDITERIYTHITLADMAAELEKYK